MTKQIITEMAPGEAERDMHQVVEVIPGESNVIRKQQDLIAEYGEGLPWSADHYAALIRKEYESSLCSYLRAGRLLIVAKAHCTRKGEFDDVLQQAEISRSAASRMMNAAELCKPDGAMTKLPKSKVAELMALPESEIKELDAGGKVDGKDVDDIANMTRAELRAWRAERDKQLEDLKLNLQAKDELARVSRAKIDRLEAELDKANRKRIKATPNEQITELQNSLNVLKQEVEYLLNAPAKDPPTNSLLAIATELLDVGNAHGLDQSHYLAGIVFELMTKLKVVRDHLCLPILEEEKVPSAGAGEVR